MTIQSQSIDPGPADLIHDEISRFLEATDKRSEWLTSHACGPERRSAGRLHHRSWPMRVMLDPRRDDTDFSVALHNASRQGIAFLTSRPLAVDARIFIRLFWYDDNAVLVPAVVRHATPADGGYLVGCEFALNEVRFATRSTAPGTEE
jgi:hypothetical protein